MGRWFDSNWANQFYNMLCPNGHDAVVRYGYYTKDGNSYQKYRCNTCHASFSPGCPTPRWPECPNGHVWVRKAGTYQHRNGETQRYRCHVCDVTWSQKQMNRLPQHIQDSVVAYIEQGKSIRQTANKLEISDQTVHRYRRIFGFKWKKPPLKGPKRDRTKYLKTYTKKTGLTQVQRLHRNAMVNAHIALWLAKTNKLQTRDQIYAAMKPQFPHLTKTGLYNMLRCNGWLDFQRVGNRWKYSLGYFIPIEAPEFNGKQHHPDRLIRQEARKIYCERNNITDKLQQHIEATKERERREQDLQAIKSVKPMLQLMATGAAILTYETHRKTN